MLIICIIMLLILIALFIKKRYKPFPIITSNYISCGPICLQMIIQDYGIHVDSETLMEHFKSEDAELGTSIQQLSNAAEDLGLESLSVKVSTEMLLNEVPLPCILHFDSNFFVVLYDVDETVIFIADPVKGEQIYSIDELKERWIVENNEGIALLFEKKESVLSD